VLCTLSKLVAIRTRKQKTQIIVHRGLGTESLPEFRITKQKLITNDTRIWWDKEPNLQRAFISSLQPHSTSRSRRSSISFSFSPLSTNLFLGDWTSPVAGESTAFSAPSGKNFNSAANWKGKRKKQPLFRRFLHGFCKRMKSKPYLDVDDFSEGKLLLRILLPIRGRRPINRRPPATKASNSTKKEHRWIFHT
jgi:hypothetical protein